MNNHFSTGQLVDFVHGELPPADDALVHAHLAACPACRLDYDAELAVGDVLRKAALAEEREMPSLVSAAVWQQIRNAQPSPIARLAAWLRPAIALPVAAALVLGGLFASPYFHPGAAQPTIDASYYLETHAAQAGQSPLSEHSGPQMLETTLGETTRPMLIRQADSVYAASGTVDAVQ